MEKVKIFISYKNRNKLLKNEILTPIQTGRAIADEVFGEMIGDDTGENISSKNERYCELTAQYWVWKNYEQIGNPEYVGFMHYRRQIIFDKSLKHLPYLWLPKTQFYFVDSIYDGYMKHFSADKILPYLENKPDCIAFKKIDIMPVSRKKDMKEHFYHGMPYQKKEVFEIFEQVISKNQEYRDTFYQFKNSHYMFCCNSFVMPKNMFFEYCEFLFSILEQVDELVDYSQFNSAEKRFLGFIGEYMLSIFIFHKLKNPDFNLLEMPGTFVSKDYRFFARRLKKYKTLIRISYGKKRKHYMKKYIYYKRMITAPLSKVGL